MPGLGMSQDSKNRAEIKSWVVHLEYLLPLNSILGDLLTPIAVAAITFNRVLVSLHSLKIPFPRWEQLIHCS